MTRKDFLPFGKPNFSDDEIAAVARVLKSGWVGMGPETIAFEQELAAHVGVPHVVTVNSCTSALFLSLVVSGVGAGDEGSYYFDAYVGPTCAPDAPDLSGGRFWHQAGGFESSYGNACLRGACALAELPVESVTVKTSSSCS